MLDNSTSQKLLEWINHQWKQIGGTTTLYHFSQLQKSSLLYQLLQKVHPSYFQSLNHLSLEFDPYFNTIQTFLLEIQGKRIRRSFKRQIIEEHSTSHIIQIILWLLLQSQQKNQFINRIFELHVETQTSLMVNLKIVDDALENYIEIKDILTTVETLEEQNEELRDKLKSYSDATKQLQQTVQQIKQTNKKMQKQVVKYETEKHTVLEQLQLNDLKQYMQIYRTVKKQNEQLSKSIHDSQQKRNEVQLQNTLLKQKINQDCDVICSLQDQFQKVRLNFQQAKDEVSILTSSYRNSFDDSVLRQNKNINNTKMRQSMETNCSIGYSKILWQLQEDGQSQKLRNYNEEMMEKLQNAYKAISQLTGEVTRLKEEKKKIEKRNENLERKVKDIKTEHNRFVKELRNCGF